ncbi:MAG: hypothetical protein ACR652_01610 [Methylocystis sp.]|uniref:hypothetical protein n=1 Tax=Methylocystis sp. TaxID=1911079 RepID=UPI003DA2CF1D
MVSKKDIAAVVVTTIVALAGFELFLEHVARIKPVPSGWGWAASPRRLLSKSTGDAEANQLGYRGQPIQYGKDDYVVVLVGDSQVEAASEPLDKMPERLLEAELASRMGRPVKVFSLAASGWGQDQQLQALDRYLKDWRADMVLAWATPGNDFWENTFADRSATVVAGPIKPTFLVKDDRLDGPYYAASFYYGGYAITQLMAEVYGKAKNKPVAQMISDAWKTRLPIRPRSTSPSCAQYPKADQQALLTSGDRYSLSDKYRMESLEDLAASKTHYAPYMLPQTEMDDYQRRLTGLLLAQIKDVSGQHGAKMKVFYITKKLPSHTIVCVGTDQGGWFTVDRNFDAVMSKIVPKEDLINIPVEGGKEVNVSDADRHLSTIGNQRAMTGLAAELTR